jgi:hypothetical protein
LKNLYHFIYSQIYTWHNADSCLKIRDKQSNVTEYFKYEPVLVAVNLT